MRLSDHGISIFFSNSYKRLAALFTEVLSNDNGLEIFQKEYIIIQTRGMRKWIALQSASANDIFANFEFLSVSSFFWKLYCRLNNKEEFPEVYNVPVLKWIIYRILKQRINDEEAFASVREYVQKNEFKLFQLASNMADLYEQYMIYRPEMIEAWQAGRRFFAKQEDLPPHRHEIWQMKLWHYLKAYIPENIPDRVNLRHALSANVDGPYGGEVIRQAFGRQISIFGFTVMPLYFLDILERLSSHIRVNFFLMNPSPSDYWFDIVDVKQKAKMETHVLKERKMDTGLLHLETGNPLLASMGKVGRDFLSSICSLESADYNVADDFIVKNPNTLLSKVQDDIATLRDRTATAEKGIFRQGDRSIEIVSCYSPLREVEVLSDCILDIFNRSPGSLKNVRASDILVVTPDIDTYSPYIHQVFSVFDGSTSGLPAIPFTIADQSLERDNLCVAVMKKIVALPGKRAKVNEIFSIINSKPVREKFFLSPDDVLTLRDYIKSAGIRWGMDTDHRESLGLPSYNEGSWHFGMTRLMAGYAMQQEKGKEFNGIIPCARLEGDDTKALGKCITIVNTLFAFLKESKKAKSYTKWINLFLNMTELLFNTADIPEERGGTTIIKDILVKIKHNIEKGVFHSNEKNQPIQFEIFRAEFSRHLDMADNSGYSFLSRGITFSSVVPMRSIPFRVICMMGMDEENFPRKNRRSDYDLLKLSPRKGDRNTRDNDLYLFLEMLLSAEDKLYISYTGKSIKDDSDRLPSQAVSQLTDYLDRGFAVKGHKTGRVTDYIKVQHPLQPFSIKYFNREQKSSSLFTYRTDMYYSPEISSPDASLPFIELPVAKDNQGLYNLSVKRFAEFFKDPAGFFHKNRIGALFPEPQEPLPEEEIYDADGLLDFRIRQKYVEESISNGNLDWQLKLMASEGDLPYGKYRQKYIDRMKRDGEMLFERIKTYTSGSFSRTGSEGEVYESQGVRVTLEELPVVKQNSSNTYVGWHAAAKKPKHIIEVLLYHLFLNAVSSGIRGTRTMFLFTDSILDLDPLEKVKSQALFSRIIKLYLHGLTTPLVFFPEASFTFVETMKRVKSSTNAFIAGKKRFFDDYRDPEINRSQYFQHYFNSKKLFDDLKEEFIKNSRTLFFMNV